MSAVTARAVCAVETLRLYNVRNYRDETVAFDEGLNVIIGANAQGKTNLLEAVAALLLGRSPRTTTLSELLRWNEHEAAIDARIQRTPSPLSISLRIHDDGSRAGRTHLVDDKPRPARAILGLCPVVLFWPDDLQLVKAGPDQRRRRLDVVASQLDSRYALELLRYRRVVDQRNALLRQLRGGGDLRELDGFDEELIELGASLRVFRTSAVHQLSPFAAQALSAISDRGEQLALRYTTHRDGDSSTTPLAQAALREQLAASRQDELDRGQTLVGPHRDDVEIVLDERPARSFASQGQQRSAVLAMTLAEVRYIHERTGSTPLLMLDDVLSELDPARRERLLTALQGVGSPQTLVTGTNADEINVSSAARYTVTGGSVTRVR